MINFIGSYDWIATLERHHIYQQCLMSYYFTVCDTKFTQNFRFALSISDCSYISLRTRPKGLMGRHVLGMAMSFCKTRKFGDVKYVSISNPSWSIQQTFIIPLPRLLCITFRQPFHSSSPILSATSFFFEIGTQGLWAAKLRHHKSV